MRPDTRTEELSRIDLLLEDCPANTPERIRLELEWVEMRGLADDESEAA